MYGMLEGLPGVRSQFMRHYGVGGSTGWEACAVVRLLL